MARHHRPRATKSYPRHTQPVPSSESQLDGGATRSGNGLNGQATVSIAGPNGGSSAEAVGGGRQTRQTHQTRSPEEMVLVVVKYM